MKNNIYRYLFFAIVLFYALFLSQFGLENWDTGYITSFSWRIVNGAAPYDDFIYKGPPVMLYLHALWLEVLPEVGQFYFVRLVNYLLFALQVFLTISAFNRIYDFKKLGCNKWALMSLGFVVSLLNFPAFPWPTTDGLLFASGALYLMANTNPANLSRLFIIALLCMLSALTKQSFYLVPIIFLVWVFVKDGLYRSLFFLLSLMILTACYYYFITTITSWERYIQLTTGETNLEGLIYVGIHEYKAFFRDVFILVPIIVLSAVVAYLKRKQSDSLYLSFFRWFPVGVLAAAIVLCLLNEIRIASRVALVASAILVAYALMVRKESVKQLAPIIVAMGIAWCASISFGYSYPIFYATGIMVCIIVLAHAEISELMARNYVSATAVIIGMIAFSNNYRLYREQPLPMLTYPMEAISPKLKYIKTHQENYDKHLDLKSL
ncbi:MAG TPA: hypothetical protein VFQ50_02345, partial [Flavobacterium sp.]|nr:hypothetical protein [Flavobacterium sp.]